MPTIQSIFFLKLNIVFNYRSSKDFCKAGLSTTIKNVDNLKPIAFNWQKSLF